MSDNKDEKVRNAIMEAAKRVFQKWGLNKTTMEDIAHEAGKGKSTLYYYYKSKDEIFEALATNELNSIINTAKTLSNSMDSSKEKIKKYITTILKETKKTVSIYPLVKGEIIANRQLIDKIGKQFNDKEESVILEMLKQGLKSGEVTFLSEKELSKAANAIVGIMNGVQMYLFFDNEDDERIEIVTRMITEGV